ncbi:MAG: DASS family sodium-coupled anion symporter [Gemmatimonadota bacterium]
MPISARVSRKELLGIAAAVIGSAVVLLLPAPAALPPAAQRTAAVFVVTLVLYLTEAVPVAITSLLAVALQPLFGVASIQTAIAGSISPVFFFVIAMFCIAQALISAGLDRRFALWLLSLAGTDSRRVLGAFMAGAAAISTIVSDVPCTALFMAIALGLFDKMGLRPGESRFAKAVMMGIPIAAFIGGLGTPAGSAINVLGIGFLEQYGKVRVPFLAWMAIGMPMVILLLPVAWWALLRFYPPEMAAIGAVASVPAERAALGPMRRAEKRVLVVLALMLALWIASTWVKQLDTTLVAVLGAAALFLPGMGLFGWKEVERGTGWDVLLVIAGVTSLGAASAKTGLAQWLVSAALGGLSGAGPVLVVAVVSAFTILVRLLLPIGPVIVAVLVPPIVLLAQQSGANPALYALPVVFTASCAFLLPLDAVTLVTYSKGYYGMLEMAKPGLVISVVWVVVMTGLIAVLGPLLGWL